MGNKKVWLIAVDGHIAGMEYLVASTEKKAEELMRLVLDKNFHGAEPDKFYDEFEESADACVKQHAWGNGEDRVRIIEAELDSPYFVS